MGAIAQRNDSKFENILAQFYELCRGTLFFFISAKL